MGFVHPTKELTNDEIDLYNLWIAEKAQKNFEKADQLRSELQEKGII